MSVSPPIATQLKLDKYTERSEKFVSDLTDLLAAETVKAQELGVKLTASEQTRLSLEAGIMALRSDHANLQKRLEKSARRSRKLVTQLGDRVAEEEAVSEKLRKKCAVHKRAREALQAKFAKYIQRSETFVNDLTDELSAEVCVCARARARVFGGG